MNRIFEISAVTLSLGLTLMGGAASVRAADASAIRIIKPFAAVGFNAGEKHGMGYFYNAAKHCILVLTIADEPDWDGAQSFTATRHEEDIPAGAATRYNSTEGKALEFTCLSDASAMSIREVQRVVAK